MTRTPCMILTLVLLAATVSGCAPMVGGAIVVGADAALEDAQGGDGLF